MHYLQTAFYARVRLLTIFQSSLASIFARYSQTTPQNPLGCKNMQNEQLNNKPHTIFSLSTLTTRLLHTENAVHAVGICPGVLPGLKLLRIAQKPQDIFTEQVRTFVDHELHCWRSTGQVNVVLVPEQGGRDTEGEVERVHLVGVGLALDMV